MKEAFKKTAACACSGAGGALAGHAGCVIAPLVVASGIASGGLSLAFGAAITAGGLYLWHRLRGKQAGKIEKVVTIGSALSGLLLMASFHLSAHKEHQDYRNMLENAPRCGDYSIPKVN